MIPLRQFHGRSMGVFGLGKAGQAAIVALLAGGATEVYAWDDNADAVSRARENPALKDALLQPIEQWGWGPAMAAVVMSPGVPPNHAVVAKAQQHQIKVKGEVDILHEEYPDARYVGITGTNGKSTTTALIGHILQHCGVKVQVGGNLGTPALALEPLGADGVYVLEMSSYQVDLSKDVRFDAAILLNITPDHLERYGTMEVYVASKKRIFNLQGDGDVAIVGLDDGYTSDIYIELLRERRAKVIPVSTSQQARHGITVNQQGGLEDQINDQNVLHFDLRQALALPGQHNWENIASAYAACRSLGLKAADIFHAICTFKGLPHRLEEVGAAYGIHFINDSKATNAEASSHALKAYSTIYWIIGGRQKAGGIANLEPLFDRIRHAFLIGEAAQDFAKTLDGKVPYTHCGDLRNAVTMAAQRATAERVMDSVVLLSPACASFDQWKSFEERGDAFRKYVQEYLREQGMGGVANGA